MFKFWNPIIIIEVRAVKLYMQHMNAVLGLYSVINTEVYICLLVSNKGWFLLRK